MTEVPEKIIKGPDPSYWQGENNHSPKVAFVLSCPGWAEEQWGYPAAGSTGRNLDYLLKVLNKQYSEVFYSDYRYDYRITNSSNKVHYLGKDNPEDTVSSPRPGEITDHLQELRTQLEGMTYIIFMGENAKKAKEKLSLKGRVVMIEQIHPTDRSLTRIDEPGIVGPKDAPKHKLKPKDAHKQKLKNIESLAKKIIDDIKREKVKLNL